MIENARRREARKTPVLVGEDLHAADRAANGLGVRNSASRRKWSLDSIAHAAQSYLCMRCALLVLLLAAQPLAAQTERSGESLRERSIPSASEGDSAGALRLLDAAVRANASDGEAWHRRGVLAWRMSGAEKRTGFMKRSANEALLNVADSSLRLATRYAPGTPGYLVDLGRFDLTSNSAAVRRRAKPLFEEALKAARKGNDAHVLSRAADEMGMTWWRHYEDIADRNIYSTIIKQREGPHVHEGSAIDRVLRRPAGDSRGGAGLVGRARVPEGIWSCSPRRCERSRGMRSASRHVYRALVDRQRWVELEHLARVRLIDDHTDGWAWLALGLGSHRLGDEHRVGYRIRQRVRRFFRRPSARGSTNLARIVDARRTASAAIACPRPSSRTTSACTG